MATEEATRARDGAAAPESPLRNREFRGLVAAQVSSELGDQLARLALASLILATSGSVLLTALAFGVSFLPAVVGSALLGRLADRRPRRSVMLVCDAVRTVVVGLLALVAAPGAPVLGLLALLFLAELCSAPFAAAHRSILPDVLPDPRQYLAASGLQRVLNQVDQALGLALGGVLIQLVPVQVALGVDAASFALSFLLVLGAVKRRPAAVLTGLPGMRAYLRDLAAGARVTVADPVRRMLVLLAWGASVVLIAPEAVALAYARDAGFSDLGGGLLMAAVPTGAALGAYAIGRVPPVRQVRVVLALATLACLPLVATFAEPPVAVAGVLWLVSGACQGFMVPLIATVNLATPPEQRGLVNGLAASGFGIATAGAFVLAGAVADATSPATAVGILGVVGLVLIGLVRVRWPARALRRVARRAYATPAG